MLTLLGLNGAAKAPHTAPEDGERASDSMLISDVPMAEVSLPMSFLQPSAETGFSLNLRNERITSPSLTELAEITSPAAALPLTPPAEKDAGTRLSAYTLGNFRLSINDENLLEIPSGRGLAVLKFLLANQNQEVPREVLMDTLWRDAAPSSARNRLNVALHSLRSALRSRTQTPIILFKDGNYFFNTDIQVWTDFEEFERHLRAGRKLEAAGQLPEAIIEYEIAASLYQGDFLEEDLYEDWPVLTRERLRVAYLDVLDRLSQIYFSRNQYAACVALCQQILERDNCREDAHCRLMRCFSRQGQQRLALRQYQVCTDALRQELDIDPEPATTQLADRIRMREQV